MSTVFVRRWLYTSSAFVAGTVLIGGATRLTNSGLSIVEWRPVTGIVPPITDTQWEGEFSKYKSYPEYIQNPINVQEFKYIYFYEWSHRVFARAVGVVFAVPYVYLMARGNLSGKMKLGLTAMLAGYGAQGALGWYMVKSGMSKELLDNKQKATVSAYRLASHLTLAMALYTAMLATALSLGPKANTLVPARRGLRGSLTVAVGCVFMSLVSGAATAGLDAGMLYTDFPWMGEGVLPPWADVVTLSPTWRNFFENGTCAQLWHKGSACVSLGAVGVVSVLAAGTAGINPFLRAVQGMVLIQAGLGISTLMLQVYIPVALCHQAGALLLIWKLLRMRSVLKF